VTRAIVLQEPDFSYENFAQDYPSTLKLAQFCAICRESKEKIEEHLKEKNSDWEVEDVREKWWCAYKGVALVNKKKKQLVLVHRGTVFKNVLNWISNLFVLYLRNTGFQLWQACIFAKDMKTLCLENGYQMIITGHSMGGVLAQGSAFSAKYLRIENGNYKYCKDTMKETHNFHPHVKCFDSPGSYKVISNLVNKWNGEKGIADKELVTAAFDLDLNNFVVTPSGVNTTGVHVGTVICVDKDLYDKIPVSFYRNHELDTIIEFLKQNVNHFSKIYYWTIKENKADEFSNHKIPYNSFTTKELKLIKIINISRCLNINPRHIEVCNEIPLLTTATDERQAMELPDGTHSSKFLPYIHHLSREHYEEYLTNDVKKYLADPPEMLEYFSFDIKHKKIYSMSTSHVDTSIFFNDVATEPPKLLHIVLPSHTNQLQRNIYAALFKNSFATKHPDWRTVILFEMNSVNVEKLKDIINEIAVDSSENWMFIVVQNDKADLNTTPEDFLSQMQVKNKIVICITNEQHSSLSAGIRYSPFETNLLMKSLDEESQKKVRELTVGLQNTEFVTTVSFSDLLELNILEVMEKYEKGCLMPNTWNDIVSDEFHMPQSLLTVDGKSVKVEVIQMLSEPNSALNIVAARPGMGKTSLFIDMRKKFSKMMTTSTKKVIVLLVSMSMVNKLLEKMTDNFDATVLYSYFILKNNSIEKKLFESFLDKDQSVVFLFDGFDEVWDSCRDKAVKVIEFFRKQSCVYQIWVSTRLDTISCLQSKNLKPYRVFDLDLFSEDDQKEFLRKLLMEDGSNENVQLVFQKMVKITQKFGQESLGIPLTLKLLVLGKAHHLDCKLSDPHDLIELYIDEKIRNFLTNRQGRQKNHIAQQELRNFRLNNPFNYFLFYALHQLFDIDKSIKDLNHIDLFFKRRAGPTEFHNLRDIGLLDGENKFVHRTIAEYWVALSLKILLGADTEEQQNGLLDWIKECTFNVTSTNGNNTKISCFLKFIIIISRNKISLVTWSYLDDMLIDFFASEKSRSMEWRNHFSEIVNMKTSNLVNYLVDVAKRHTLPGILYLLKSSMSQIMSPTFFYTICGIIRENDFIKGLHDECFKEVPSEKNIFYLLETMNSPESVTEVKEAIIEIKRDSKLSKHLVPQVYELGMEMGIDFSDTYHLPSLFPYDLHSFVFRNPPCLRLLKYLESYLKSTDELIAYEFPIYFYHSQIEKVRDLVLQNRLYSCLINLDKTVDILQFNSDFIFDFPLVKSRHDVPLLVKMICFGNENACLDLIEFNTAYLTDAVDFIIKNYEVFTFIAKWEMNKLIDKIAHFLENRSLKERNVINRFVNNALLKVVIDKKNMALLKLLFKLGFSLHQDWPFSSPLLFALFKGDKEIIELLIQNQALEGFEPTEEKDAQLDIASCNLLEAFRILENCERYKGKYFGKYDFISFNLNTSYAEKTFI